MTLFGPFYIQGLPPRRLRGVSNFRKERREAKAPLKWQPVQPIKIVVLIVNGSPLWRLTFSRQNFIQGREADQISSLRLGGSTLNAAQETDLGLIN